jgi:cobalt transporter subunit CbtB
MTETTQTTAVATTGIGIMPMVFAALIGIAIVGLTGIAHAQVVHDAAHDLRHASGFPCH